MSLSLCKQYIYDGVTKHKINIIIFFDICFVFFFHNNPNNQQQQKIEK